MVMPYKKLMMIARETIIKDWESMKKDNPDMVWICPYCGNTVSPKTHCRNNIEYIVAYNKNDEKLLAETSPVSWYCPNDKCGKHFYKPNERIHKREGTGTVPKTILLNNDELIIKHDKLVDAITTHYNQVRADYKYIGKRGKYYMKEIRNIAYLCFLYLTASRVSEVCGKRNPDRRIQYKLFLKDGGMMMKRHIYMAEDWLFPPLLRHQIETSLIFQNSDKAFMKVNKMIVLKRRKAVYRNVLIQKDEYHKPFVNILMEYLELADKRYRYNPEKIETSYIVFPFLPNRGWGITNKILGKEGLNINNGVVFNHLLRHSRISSLILDLGWTGMVVQKFVRWSSLEMLNTYFKADDEDIAKAYAQSNTFLERKEDIKNDEEKDVTREDI